MVDARRDDTEWIKTEGLRILQEASRAETATNSLYAEIQNILKG